MSWTSQVEDKRVSYLVVDGSGVISGTVMCPVAEQCNIFGGQGFLGDVPEGGRCAEHVAKNSQKLQRPESWRDLEVNCERDVPTGYGYKGWNTD